MKPNLSRSACEPRCSYRRRLLCFWESSRTGSWTSPASRPHWSSSGGPLYPCHAQPGSECPQNRSQGLHTRVALLRERPVQALAIQTGTGGDLSDASLSLRYGAQRDQENSRVLFVKGRIKIDRQAHVTRLSACPSDDRHIGCASRHSASSGNPRGILWRGECPFVEGTPPWYH